LLNASTIATDSFTVTPAGASAPVGVEGVRYYPRTGEIRLYTAESLSADSLPCRVTAEGLYDVEGNAFYLDKAVYMLTENECAVDAVSIAAVTYLREDGTPVYDVSQTAGCTTCARLVNQTAQHMEVTVVFYAMQNGVEVHEITRKTVVIPRQDTLLVSQYVPVAQGQTIGVKLSKTEPVDNLLSAPHEVYFQDFDGLAAGVADAASIGLDLPGTGTAQIVQKNGTNILCLAATGKNGANPILGRRIFSSAMAQGTIVTSFKLAPIDTSVYAGGRHLMGYYTGDVGSSSVLEATDGWYEYPAGIRTKVSAPAVNSKTGMHHLRTVLTRKHTADDWTFILYDDAGETPVVRYRTVISAETVTAVRIADLWPDTKDGALEVYVDDVAVKLYHNPFIE